MTLPLGLQLFRCARSAARGLIAVLAAALALGASSMWGADQWDALPRYEPGGAAPTSAPWKPHHFLPAPEAPPVYAAQTSWTSRLWPFGHESTPANSAAPSRAENPAIAAGVAASQAAQNPAATPTPAPTATPAAGAAASRSWFDRELWGLQPMPGQSALKAPDIPATSPHSPAQPPGDPLSPPPRLAERPGTQTRAYPAAMTSPQPALAAGAPRTEPPATTYYNGHGWPVNPIANAPDSGLAPRPSTMPSLVAESLASVDPDELLADDGAWSWQMLPKSLIYHTYLAGVKEPRLGAVFNSENNRGTILDLAAGARMGVLRYGTRDVFEPDGWQLDVEGAAFTRLDPQENMDMEATDYKFGVPLTYGWGCYQMKFAYSHLSSHLGDEYAIRNGLAGRINYSRDALVWGHSLYATPDLRLYFEVGFALFCDVNEPWDTQFGVEYSPICNGRWGAPFAAFNSHLREEVNFGGNFVMQLGWQWTSPETAHRMRIGMQYYNGNEEQFEFYNVSEQKVGLGLWYDF